MAARKAQLTDRIRTNREKIKIEISILIFRVGVTQTDYLSYMHTDNDYNTASESLYQIIFKE